jgi:hypothetical protein
MPRWRVTGCPNAVTEESYQVEAVESKSQRTELSQSDKGKDGALIQGIAAGRPLRKTPIQAQRLLMRLPYSLRGRKHEGDGVHVLWLNFAGWDAHLGEVFELDQQIDQGHRIN